MAALNSPYLSRAQLLLGDEGMRRLASARILLVGVGGVGSWCAEGLVRSGIRQLTLVDGDQVVPSNVNRQLMALPGTVGQLKVEALKAHLLAVAPDAEIIARAERFNAETAESFDLESFDVIVDAIDSLKDKAELILRATAAEHPRLYSSMGAALKVDPRRIRVAEFWDVRGCPLGAALRKKLRKAKTLPSRPFPCVYGDELRENRGSQDEIQGNVNGTLLPITGIFGFTLAGLIIQDLVDASE